MSPRTSIKAHPTGNILHLQHGTPLGVDTRPTTPMQALMECRPHEEPPPSVLETMLDDGTTFEEYLADVLAQLTPRERRAWDYSHNLRMSARDMAAAHGMSATSWGRALLSARTKLHDLLVDTPWVSEWKGETHER